MLPIPAKFHYTFNLRDVAKVFQGILMSERKTIMSDEKDQKMYGKLWLHECTRVFADRLCTQEDIKTYQEIAFDIMQSKFKMGNTKFEEIFGSGVDIIFSFLLKLDIENPYYDLIRERSKLKEALEGMRDDFNSMNKNKMDLVFFEDAMKHICSIIRILMQPRGNAMLIGVSGSGKQSLTKLAAFILKQEFFQIALSKNFKTKDFRDSLKERMLDAGTLR